MRASRVSGEALGGHHIIVDDVELGAETVKVRSEVDREVAVLFASVCGLDGRDGVRRWRVLDVGR